ncbi:MAG: hypothetical protein V1773_04490 [bacterium]
MEKEFIKNWIIKNSKLLQKEFPNDFVDFEQIEELNMPEKNLIFGDPFFGLFQICDISGEVYFQEEDIYKVKYIIYSNKNKPKKISIPVKQEDINLAVKSYEKYLDEIILQIKQELNQLQVKVNNDEIVQQIFKALNLIRF